MSELSIDLTGDLSALPGIVVADLILEKIKNPGVEMRLGDVSLARITNVAHLNRDGRLTVTAETTTAEPYEFNFDINYTPLSETAVDQDGQPIY